MTAPPSELLTEIRTVYEAAYNDLLAAEEIPDENYPHLEDHMDPGQAEAWRETIRKLVDAGQKVIPAKPVMLRIERLDRVSSTMTKIEVCRQNAEEVVDSGLNVVGKDFRPNRYTETFEIVNGSWKWTGHEWIDPSPDWSDCALR